VHTTVQARTDPEIAWFARLAIAPDPELDMGEAALRIASARYPLLNVRRYLGRLDAIARTAGPRAARCPHLHDKVEVLREVVYKDLGLRGNGRQYYDPRNSYLNEVLDRRLGIPLTMAIVLLEVAERIHVPLRGVSFPGHFLVRVGETETFMDPWEGGRLLSVDDCRILLERQGRGSFAFDRRFLRPATKREILLRLLRNLKVAHTKREEWEEALAALDRLLALAPEEVAELRDRGELNLRADRYSRAIQDFERYLEYVPGAPDRVSIEKRLLEARRKLFSLN